MIFVRGVSTAQTISATPQLPKAFRFSVAPIDLQSFTVSKNLPDISKKLVFLSPNFYASQLSFFCRQEIRLDKAAKLGFRFRLGSVEQCDLLEGKRNLR